MMNIQLDQNIMELADLDGGTLLWIDKAEKDSLKVLQHGKASLHAGVFPREAKIHVRIIKTKDIEDNEEETFKDGHLRNVRFKSFIFAISY